MGDTGAMSLGVTLGVVAMLTNTALFLPIIGFVFMLESASVIIQVASKNCVAKSFFVSATSPSFGSDWLARTQSSHEIMAYFRREVRPQV